MATKSQITPEDTLHILSEPKDSLIPAKRQRVQPDLEDTPEGRPPPRTRSSDDDGAHNSHYTKHARETPLIRRHLLPDLPAIPPLYDDPTNSIIIDGRRVLISTKAILSPEFEEASPAVSPPSRVQSIIRTRSRQILQASAPTVYISCLSPALRKAVVYIAYYRPALPRSAPRNGPWTALEMIQRMIDFERYRALWNIYHYIGLLEATYDRASIIRSQSVLLYMLRCLA
uniref:Uncharacterized protein n=1 Tax=Bionectria ochroleuca TaxID=29856 RepID=A0A0B7KNP7_BIOOC